MNTANTLQHLDSRMHSLANADGQTRIRTLEKDLFIEHDYSRHLSSLLAELITGPRQTRMPCLLITGDAGMGKTAQLHRFQRQFADALDPVTGVLQRPIVMANVPPEPTRVTLTFALLEALRAPIITSHRSVDKSAVIRRLLAAHRTRVVVFDEIQHLCYSRRRDRLVVLDTIKAVSTVHQVNVICAGTNGVEREFLAAPQVERRFDIATFTPWRADGEFRRFLGAYERVRPLRLPSRLAEPEMMQAILEETRGITHRVIQRLNAAAIVAVHERLERITPDLICVQRTDPARVHAARRAAQQPSGEIDDQLIQPIPVDPRISIAESEAIAGRS
ncbi:MAG: TniB family NTP-binding protein [Verrucomicrobiia bacterium]